MGFKGKIYRYIFVMLTNPCEDLTSRVNRMVKVLPSMLSVEPRLIYNSFADDVSLSSHKQDPTSEPVKDDYGRICKNQGTLPSGKFKKQIHSPVADMSHSLLGTKDIKSIAIALTVSTVDFITSATSENVT